MATINNNSAQTNQDTEKKAKIHPWRLCPVGEHWVRSHSMHIPPSKKHPEGYETIRRGHCAQNPSGKDVFYPEEINKISEQSFKNIEPKACPLELNYGAGGSKYDYLIAGWTKYWNEVFTLSDPLDPNFVKALIATESSFDPNNLADRKNPNSARGLMQITNLTRKILGDEKGELKNHFINVTREELNDPSTNICAGIRWLFHKRKLASSKLNRQATWNETVYEFKGLKTVPKERAEELLGRVSVLLEKYKKCEKK
ncbi:MAG: transglycosylase SLT domain-containing protein [Silvanigrellaceae bacterium]|nr:transglycosylase SLT domain-containing protein [Silvanigrellaceae bacterium]